MVIIDASVAVKWVVTSRTASSAERLLGERAGRAGAMAGRSRERALEQVPRHDLSEERGSPCLRDAAAGSGAQITARRGWLAGRDRLRAALRHPVYDCFYLAAAQVYDTHLVTADRASPGGWRAHPEHCAPGAVPSALTVGPAAAQAATWATRSWRQPIGASSRRPSSPVRTPGATSSSAAAPASRRSHEPEAAREEAGQRDAEAGDAERAAERGGDERPPGEAVGHDQHHRRIGEHERHQRLGRGESEGGVAGAHRVGAGDAGGGVGGERHRRRDVGEHAEIEHEEMRDQGLPGRAAPSAGAATVTRMM